MATSRASKSSILQGFPKSRSLLAGNTAYEPGDFQSIATTTVGAGGVASVTFSSIPSDYSHLQVRIIARDTRAVVFDNLYAQVNGDTGSNYSYHYIQGDASSVYAGNSASNTVMIVGSAVSASSTADYFAPSIIDILDYTNTNKYKTFRSLTGCKTTSPGLVTMFSGSWRNTSAINSLTFIPAVGNFTQYSSFALYGIK